MPCWSKAAFLIAAAALRIEIALSIAMWRPLESDCTGVSDDNEFSSSLAEARRSSQCLGHLCLGYLEQTEKDLHLTLIIRFLGGRFHYVGKDRCSISQYIGKKFGVLFPSVSEIESLAFHGISALLMESSWNITSLKTPKLGNTFSISPLFIFSWIQSAPKTLDFSFSAALLR